MPRQEVAVIGAGICGLTTGIALRKAGFEVVVYEQAAEIGPVGAGVVVQCNAMTALRRIGLANPVAAAGRALQGNALRRWDGRVLARIPLAELVAEVGEPAIAIHRADLHAVLLEALGAERVQTGKRCTAVDLDGAAVRVTFADGGAARADIVVGADGIHSAVRAQLFGDIPPRYAGYTCWRGITGGGAIPATETGEWWGRGVRFGCVHIDADRLYWYLTCNAAPGGRDPDEGPLSHLLALVRGWQAPIEQLVGETPPEAIIRADICDRPPIKNWCKGRIALAGDAAHPMTPNMGQGACQAIEDAVVLVDCLRADPSPAAALVRYNQRRQNRANDFVRRSWRIGRWGQYENGFARWLRDLGVRLTPKGSLRKQALAAWRYPY